MALMNATAIRLTLIIALYVALSNCNGKNKLNLFVHFRMILIIYYNRLYRFFTIYISKTQCDIKLKNI